MSRAEHIPTLAQRCEELQTELIPARGLLNILRGLAIRWQYDPRSKEDDGCYRWLAGCVADEPQIDGDYIAIEIGSAMLLGVADRIEEAFDTLARAVREKAESDREIGGAP